MVLLKWFFIATFANVRIMNKIFYPILGFVYNIVSSFIIPADLAEDKVPGPGTGYLLYQQPAGVSFSHF